MKLLLLFLGLFALAAAQSSIEDRIGSNILIIDPFLNEVNAPGGYLVLNASCGSPDGALCDARAPIEVTFVQPRPGLSWPAGGAPIGGERFSYLSIDTIEAGYNAGVEDNIQVTYDQPQRVRVATSPGIGGTYLILWNGPGNNQLPCRSTLAAPCALDEACCNGPIQLGGLADNGTAPIDLTQNGTQFGIGLYQRASDHPSPVILRIWGSNGKSVVLRKFLEADFTQRNILFLYRDFTPFPGEDTTQAGVMDILKNARAIAMEIFGAIALDAKFTEIRTAGVYLEKDLDPAYVGVTLKTGDKVCYTAYIFNTAPISLDINGTNQANVLILNDVEFTDTAFIGSPVKLDRTSIDVTPQPGGSVDLHENDPFGVDSNLLRVTLLDPLYPGQNVTIKFCGVVRNDYVSPTCTGQFCNTATVSVPGFGAKGLGSNATCIPIKFDAILGLDINCPASLKVNDPPTITLNWRNTGNAPALNTVLEMVLVGLPPSGLSDPLNAARGWTCAADSASPNTTLRCTKPIGRVEAGSTNSALFGLTIGTFDCSYNNLAVSARISETCSNSTAVATCNMPLLHNVTFEIIKTASLSSGSAFLPNDLITYSISYKNRGDTIAKNVVITETYDANVTPVNLNANWNCNSVTRTCTWNIGTLSPNDPLNTIQFFVRLPSALPLSLTQICNTAVISNPSSPDAAGCKDTKTSSICSPVRPGIPDTAVLKQGFIALLKYRLTYKNNGTADAANVIITESIPAGTTFVANMSDSRWVCVGSSCTLNLGTLAKGATGTVIFVVAPARDFNQPPICWNNTATIAHTSLIPDRSPGDNIATWSLGACGGNATICENPCAACPACVCNAAPCLCPPAGECTCPPAICNPAPNVTCPEPVCNCPTKESVCQPCPCCMCDCPAKCPNNNQECACKDIININLPGLKCNDEYCEYTPSHSASPYPRQP